MQYSGHCRDYEKRLHYRNCELLKLKQQLANVQQAVEERGILVEKEVESDEKLRQVEQKLQEKDTEVQVNIRIHNFFVLVKVS